MLLWELDFQGLRLQGDVKVQHTIDMAGSADVYCLYYSDAFHFHNLDGNCSQTSIYNYFLSLPLGSLERRGGHHGRVGRTHGMGWGKRIDRGRGWDRREFIRRENMTVVKKKPH